MNDKLDHYSLKLMESIFNASQENALRWAAEIRRLVLKEKMARLKQQNGGIDYVEEISDTLGELEKVANILGPEKEVII